MTRCEEEEEDFYLYVFLSQAQVLKLEKMLHKLFMSKQIWSWYTVWLLGSATKFSGLSYVWS